MIVRHSINKAARVFLFLSAVVTAPAAAINVTYQYSGFGTGDPTNPPLIFNGSGSVVPLGSMTWMDMGFPNLATGTVTGTFAMMFSNGTLGGNFDEQVDLSSPPDAVQLTQVIHVTGGTGAFLWYNGTLTGSASGSLITGAFSYSGVGTLNTTPEPASIALLPIGAMLFLTYRHWLQSTRKHNR